MKEIIKSDFVRLFPGENMFLTVIAYLEEKHNGMIIKLARDGSVQMLAQYLELLMVLGLRFWSKRRCSYILPLGMFWNKN